MKRDYSMKIFVKGYLNTSAQVALKVRKFSSYAFPEVSSKKTLVFSTLLRATSKISFLKKNSKIR